MVVVGVVVLYSGCLCVVVCDYVVCVRLKCGSIDVLVMVSYMLRVRGSKW